MLVLSLGMMGAVTFLIGLLPTYETVGLWAPVLLTALRFFQGFAVGGEWGRRHAHGGGACAARAAGVLRKLAADGHPGGPPALLGVMAGVTAATSPEQFAAWGWRVPFLLSGLLLVVGIVIRRRLSESPSFQRLKQSGRREALPIGAIIGHRKRLTALVIGSQAAENTSFHVFAVWALAYLTTTIGCPGPWC